MKRHLVFPLNFDTRALFLIDINPNWEESVKEQHRKNQIRLIDDLKIELGENNFEEKFANFKDLGPLPFSIIGYHNRFFQQCRYSFIHGFYYPALTSACALGERIFNHIIIDLRDSFKNKPSYRKVYNKGSFCKWEEAIDTMVEWGIFQHDDIETEFRKLAHLRNHSLHFNEATYSNLRADALLALQTISKIISLQFGYPTVAHKWVIQGTNGHSFIKKDSEEDPFIKRYYLPQSPLLGYKFAMSVDPYGEWLFFDQQHYDGDLLTDEDFARLYNERNPKELVATTLPLNPGINVQKIVRS